MPDRLEWKAARAGLSIEEWAAVHAGWIATHASRPDVAAWLEGQRTQASAPAQQPGEGRIPVEAAMAQAMAVCAGEARVQAMAVCAGEARAQDMVPVYEEASPGS